jgi:hypothetical protein
MKHSIFILPLRMKNRLFSLLKSTEKVEIKIQTAEGKTLVGWKPNPTSKTRSRRQPKAARLPKEIESNEQFTSLVHLEQYRHATYDPRDYYLEALSARPER